MVNVCRQCVGMKSGEIVCGEKTQLRLKLWIPTTVVCQSNKMPVEPKQTVERLSKWENLLFCSQHYFKIEHFPLHMLATTLGLNVDNANCMLTSTLWVMHFHSETPKLERILLLILLKCYSTMRKESEYVAFFFIDDVHNVTRKLHLQIFLHYRMHDLHASSSSIYNIVTGLHLLLFIRLTSLIQFISTHSLFFSSFFH